MITLIDQTLIPPAPFFQATPRTYSCITATGADMMAGIKWDSSGSDPIDQQLLDYAIISRLTGHAMR